jgi:acetolactate synthase-1/2/3 large subunit
MIDEVKKQAGTIPQNNALINEIQEEKEKHLKNWMQWLTSEEKPINPYRIMWDLMHTIDRDNSIVTHDSGNPRDQLTSFWETTVPHGYIGWGHVTTLGFGQGAAMGAALAMPERLTINFIGDASSGQVGMDWETPVRTKIPMMTIVLNNGQYGGYDRYYRHPETYTVTGNYAKVAEGLGAHAERVEEPDEIIPAIKRGIKIVDAGHYAVIEMMTTNFPKFPRFAGYSAQ